MSQLHLVVALHQQRTKKPLRRFDDNNKHLMCAAIAGLILTFVSLL